MTVWSDNVANFATRSREGAANLVLEVAVQEALEHLRAGQPGRAEYVLTRAGESAHRILGPDGTSCQARISGQTLGLQCVVRGEHDTHVFESTSGVPDRHFGTSGGEG